MAMRAPRISHKAASFSCVRSVPFKWMAPETLARSGSKPITAKAVSDLPQPLSPIKPRVSPCCISKLTPRNASTWPCEVCRATRKSRTDSKGDVLLDVFIGKAYRVLDKRGSSRSRKPSPIKLRPSTAKAMATPGYTASMGAWNICDCASFSMRPQLGLGGCVPNPK